MYRDSTRVAAAFLIGGMVGAGIALLYAPKSGKDTRKDITKAARRIKKDTVEMVDDTIESINDFVGDMKNKVSDIIDQGIELSDNAKKEIISSFEQSQDAIEKQKKRLLKTLGI